MSDPERLLDGPLPDDIAQLLRSSVGETHPTSAARQQAILAAIAAPTTPRTPGGLRHVMWLGLAAIAISAGVVGARKLGSPAPVAVVVDTPSSAPVVIPATPIAEPTSVAVPSMSVHELPTAAQPAMPKAAAPSLEDELKTIDAARGALSADPRATLAQVSRYRTLFPVPHFSDEADALEVQALAALGRTTEAKAKANAFYAAHPRSPYSQRVRSAVAETRED